MKQKHFRIPFAANGDKQAIAENSDPQGYVNYSDGFGPDYERNLATDAHAKPPERDTFNELFHDITENIKQYQENGFPEWMTTADNNGVSFPYSKQAIVNYNNKLYVSLIDDNTSTPGIDESKWQPFLFERATEQKAIDGKDRESIITPETLLAGLNNFQKVLRPYLLPIGSIIAWPSNIPPEGWLELNGDGFDKSLYPELAKILPTGVLPDFRGQFLRGWDNEGGVDSGRELLSEQGDAIRNIKGQFVANARGWATGDATNPFYWQGHAAQGNKTSWDGCYVGFDASKSVPTAEENRPRNIAVMFIIKTDLADNEQGDVPTNLIVSPRTISAGVSSNIQLTTTVLPSSLSGSFPISYQSSDTSVCTIDSNGMVKITGSGKASIVASISTGLSAIVEVTGNVLLKTLKIGSIPMLTAGDKISIPLSAAPTNYTEPLNFSSNNENIAYISASGELITTGAGTTVISVTGSISGITDSKSIIVNPAVVTETYLQISNNLSDLDSTAAARINLGLGALATKNSLTAADVSAIPLANNAIPAGTDLNSITAAGQYYQNISSNATTALNYPEMVAGALIVYKTGVDGGCRQEYMPYNSTKVYYRYAFGNPLIFSAWSNNDTDEIKLLIEQLKARIDAQDTLIAELEHAKFICSKAGTTADGGTVWWGVKSSFVDVEIRGQ